MKECTHCEFCDTESYWTVVDIGFLRSVKLLVERLDNIKPNWYVAPGFKKLLNDHIENARKNGNRNF